MDCWDVGCSEAMSDEWDGERSSAEDGLTTEGREVDEEMMNDGQEAAMGARNRTRATAGEREGATGRKKAGE